jgi:hypothetical protein
MTGNVPYYGGRLTPAQAYAAGRTAPSAAGGPVHPARPPSTVATPEENMASLQQLLDSGLITAEEYAELAARVLS